MMPLPKIDQPVFHLTLPSNNKKIKYRPYTVKEEKILLIARSAEEFDERIASVKQIIRNCVVDEDFDVENAPLFDIDYIFINLRSKSVDNIVKITVTDNEDNKEYNFDVNLDEVTVVKDKNNNPKIELTNKTGLIMRYPTFEVSNDLNNLNDSNKNYQETLIQLYAKCIEKIYDEDKVYVRGKDFNEEEALEFVNSMSIPNFNKLDLFFNTLPVVSYTIKYKNSLDKDKEAVLRGVSDFFI